MNIKAPPPPPLSNPAANVPTVVTSPLAGFSADTASLPAIHAPPLAVVNPHVLSQPDLLYLEQMLKSVPAYDKGVSGRYPLLVPTVLLDTVQSGTYSGLLQKPILTFFDAVDHDIAVARMWADEDAALQPLADAVERRRESNRRAQKAYRDRTVNAPTVQSARAAWKAAIAEKKKAMEAWDQHIRILHDAFKEARQVAGVDD